VIIPQQNFARMLAKQSLTLQHGKTEVLQVNVGKLCNLTCVHCHVNAGPNRKEIMTRETIDRVLHWLAKSDIRAVDITGGAPEMVPDFRYFIERVKALDRHVIDRCNLTILLDPGHEDLAKFLAGHEVEVIASMPCYTAGNVNAQRGEGVFEASIKALQLLNSLGYGSDPALPLQLVYNPNGAFLPGPQAELEADYKRELKQHFGIVFNNLYTITNLPIARFASYLKHNDLLADYMMLLKEAFNPQTVEGLMCRNTINVSWTGEVFDCDFNQMLKMQWRDRDRGLYLWDINPATVENREILVGDHCFGCTAGAGSSCGGALV
jgi:radical SAM/Cys-rich protein